VTSAWLPWIYLGRVATLEQIACNHNIAIEASSEPDAATNSVDMTAEQSCIATRSFALYLFISYSPYEVKAHFNHRPPAWLVLAAAINIRKLT
jgi:hypothetical protein